MVAAQAWLRDNKGTKRREEKEEEKEVEEERMEDYLMEEEEDGSKVGEAPLPDANGGFMTCP